MVSRYRYRTVFKNQDDRYINQFQERGVSFIKHFSTAKLNFPTAQDLEDVIIRIEIFKVGDRFYKYAHKYYGDPAYWWVIAHFNQKPTENMLKLGETVYIPIPLTKMLEIFED